MNTDASKPPRLPAMAQHFGLLAQPPPLRFVVARAFISCALAMRVQIDAHIDARAAAQMTGDARRWLTEHGFDALLHASEAEALDAAPRELSAGSAQRYETLGEAAAVYAWALRVLDLPAPDAAADAADVAVALGFLTDAGADLVTGARLRDRDEIARYADVAGALSWRLQQQLREPGKIVMSAWSATRWSWPQAVTPAQCLDDDLALQGKPIASVAQSDLLQSWQRAMERQRAALWLLGQHRDYWQVALQF